MTLLTPRKRSPFKLNITQWVVLAVACAGQVYQKASASAPPVRMERQNLVSITTALNGNPKTVYVGQLEVLLKSAPNGARAEIDRILYSEKVYEAETNQWKKYWTSLSLTPDSSQGPVPAVDFYGKPLVELATYQMDPIEGGILLVYLNRNQEIGEIRSLRVKIKPIVDEGRFVAELDEGVDHDLIHQIHLNVESTPPGVAKVEIIQKIPGAERRILHSFDPALKLQLKGL